MHKREIMNNTPEQVREYLAGALAIVAELDIADDLRVKAFELAVNLLSGKQIIMEQVHPSLGNMVVPRGH